jgi:hypothetical protein
VVFVAAWQHSSPEQHDAFAAVLVLALVEVLATGRQSGQTSPGGQQSLVVTLAVRWFNGQEFGPGSSSPVRGQI